MDVGRLENARLRVWVLAQKLRALEVTEQAVVELESLNLELAQMVVQEEEAHKRLREHTHGNRIYTFKCVKCHFPYEVERRESEDCPACGCTDAEAKAILREVWDRMEQQGIVGKDAR